MNERYNTIVEQIKKWYNDNTEDKNILQSLFAQAYLRENEIVDRSEDLKKGTKYSNLSNKEFSNLFATKNFNNINKTDIKHLFQELHNRYMHNKGYEPTRNVAVVDSKDKSLDTTYGYVCYADDLLFINKSAIDKAKLINPQDKNLNKTNLGISLMFIIMHESQHVTQYETALDYAMGVKQNKDDAFLGAMGVIKNTNFVISDAKNDEKYINEWQNNYNYRFVEHNANYSAFEKAMKEIPESEKKGFSFDQYNVFTTLLSLRMYSTSKESIEKRITEMEKVALKEIDYFKKGTKKCPLKDKTLKTVNSYMEKDENGNSRFRDILRNQITKIAEVSAEAQRNVDEQKALTM